MRKLLIIFTLLLGFNLNSFSQAGGSSSIGYYGFYATPVYKALSLKGATQEIQSFLGAQAGVYLTENFTAGIAYYWSLNPIAFPEQHVGTVFPGGDNLDYQAATWNTVKEVDTRYGGIYLETILQESEMFHVSVPLLIGLGASNVYNVHYEQISLGSSGIFDPVASLRELRDYEYRSWFIEKDNFFVIEPGINIEISVVDQVAVTLGSSYKMIKDNSFQNYEKGHLSIQKGMNFNFGVKVIVQ